MERAPDLADGDSQAEELDRLVTELRYATRHHDWNPPPQLIAAIADWHARAMASARTNLWIPGMAGCADRLVEAALGRFHARQVSAAIGRLHSENASLKAELVRALACIRFYATGTEDEGRRAVAALAGLLADRPVEQTTLVPGFAETRTLRPTSQVFD
jgi:hypothetical protein